METTISVRIFVGIREAEVVAGGGVQEEFFEGLGEKRVVAAVIGGWRRADLKAAHQRLEEEIVEVRGGIVEGAHLDVWVRGSGFSR